MALAYECAKCEHVQVVGQIDHGIGSHADPCAVCEGCGAVGTFHFAPGVAEESRRYAAQIARIYRRARRTEGGDGCVSG